MTNSVQLVYDVNGEQIGMEPGQQLPSPVSDLDFQIFRLNPDLESLETADFLEKIRLAEYQQ